MAYVGKGAGKKLIESIENARKTIKIVSPFLGVSTLERNLIPARNRGVKVTIITKEDQSEDILKALKEFESFRTNELHAKFYIIDDRMVYEGSANFTYTGLFKSIEQMSYSNGQHKVSEAIKSFDRIKNDCKHFKADRGNGQISGQKQKFGENGIMQILKLTGYAMCSALFTGLIFLGLVTAYPQVSADRILLGLTFLGSAALSIGFLKLFVFSDSTKNQKLRAYVQGFLGVLFFVWGVIFLLLTVWQLLAAPRSGPLGDIGSPTVLFMLATAFIYAAHKRIGAYVNLFKVVFRSRPGA